MVKVRAAEELRQHRLHLVVAGAEVRGHGAYHGVTRLALRGREIVLRRVVHQEAVQLAADEFAACRLGQGQARELVTRPVAFLAEDGLRPGVVVSLAVDEVVVLEGVARECAGAGLDVRLGVAVAFAQDEEFEKFARQVLVGSALAALVIVQVLDHRGVADHLQDQHAEVPRGVRAEQLVLLEHVPAVLDGPRTRGEVPVPEERHLLLERARGLDHARDPPLLEFHQLLAVPCLGLVLLALEALDRRFLAAATRGGELVAFLARERGHQRAVEVVGADFLVRLGLVVDEEVHRAAEAHGGKRVGLRRRAAEARAVQEVARRRCVERCGGQRLKVGGDGSGCGHGGTCGST